ncbi:MAG: ParB/RepB/Spo0J family partition protein [Ruminococcus flavefaciens]|nr:ParB/RepB/Spo0J family partition protein [Ruminococcus flavefaciens]MCM1363341.1 ParB/RepB/Spo0J family partition protein [Clostridiales bacterium]
MSENTERSVMSYGIARKLSAECYEVISGHRRLYAAKKLGLEVIPAVVYELSYEEAVIAMVDANLQREHILPSEKAWAYKMKFEALKHQGKTSDQLGPKLTTNEISDTDSATQVKRYIRLTNLIPELLDMVDAGRIAFTPAVELSYLREDEQHGLLTTIESEDCTPSLSQAQQMKCLSQCEMLDIDQIFSIITTPKANQKEMFKMPLEGLQKFSPKANRQQLEDFVMKACEHYYRYLKRQKDREER